MNAILTFPELAPAVADAIDEPNTLTLLLGTDPSGDRAATASKLFRADGRKESRTPGYWRALQLYVPHVEAMKSVLAMVGSFSHAALCNARFPGLPVYSIESLGAIRGRGIMQFMRDYGFRIWPQKHVAKTFGNALGLHRDDAGPVIARISANLQPTSWLFIDQDIDAGAPEWAFERDILDILEPHIPGIRSAPRVTSPSASARVFHNGTPLGGGHGHIWVQTQPVTSDELKRASHRVRGRMIVADECWTTPDKNGRPQIRLPIDLSGWSLGRMVYAGKPEVELGSKLIVEPPMLGVFNGQPIALTAVLEPDREALLLAQRAMHPDSKVSLSKGSRLSIDIYDLSTETEVELEDGILTSLQDVHEELIAGRESGDDQPKIRMQSPLRPESRSMAAFAALSKSNDLFIIDSGLPGECHWIKERPEDVFDTVPQPIDSAGLNTLSEPNQPGMAADAAWHPLLRFVDLDNPPATHRWVIPGFIAEGVVVIAGMHGAGKTTAILPLALVAAGIHRPDDQLAPRHWRHIVYVTEDVAQAHRILRGITQHDPDLLDTDTLRDRLHLVEARRMSVEQLVQVGCPYRERFTRVVEGVELPPLVVLDTRAAVIAEEDENGNSEASKIVAALKQQFANLPTWVIGHVAKTNAGNTDATSLSMRGGSAFEADANQVLYLIAEKDDTRFLVRGKTRFEAAWPELEIKSHTAQTMVENVWGDLENLTLRWSSAVPPAVPRAHRKIESQQAEKAAAAEVLRQNVLATVKAGQEAGMQVTKTSLREQVVGKATSIDQAINALLASGEIEERAIPPGERTTSQRKTELVLRDGSFLR